MACGMARALATHAAAPVAGRNMTLADERNHQERLRRLERQPEKAPIYLDEIDPNYRRFRQRLREVFEDGHDVLRWELHALRGGFRVVRVYVREGPPLTWDQPWEGECI